MNLEQNPTLDDLRSLIAAADDRAGHHVLWVDDHADVHLTRLGYGRPVPVFPDNGQHLRLKVEPFEAGKGYVGPEVAKDNAYLGELLTGLRKKWGSVNGTAEYLELDRIFHPEDYPS